MSEVPIIKVIKAVEEYIEAMPMYLTRKEQMKYASGVFQMLMSIRDIVYVSNSVEANHALMSLRMRNMALMAEIVGEWEPEADEFNAYGDGFSSAWHSMKLIGIGQVDVSVQRDRLLKSFARFASQAGMDEVIRSTRSMPRETLTEVMSTWIVKDEV